MLDIPDSSHAVTPAWLTEALRRSGSIDRAAVRDFKTTRIGEQEGFAGFLLRFDLDYDRDEEQAPRTIIGKFSSIKPDLRLAMKPGNEREIRFYKEIASGGEFPVPHCYYADINLDTGASVLLMEDLGHLRRVSFIGGCAPNDVEQVVRGLADFHASWWDNPRLEAMPWLASLADAPYPDWWSRYPQVVADLLPDYPLPESLLRVGERFAADMPGLLERLEGHPLACIHRDIHVDNVLFRAPGANPAFVVIDWQTVGAGRGVSDVGYFIISSIPPDQRRQTEEHLIRIYHETLVQHGVQGYSFEDCWHDYKLSVLGKLFITVQMTVLVDNSDAHRMAWRRADLNRLTAFIEDHHVDDILR